MSCEDGEAAAGGGLLVGRRWFERAIERAPEDVATSVATVILSFLSPGGFLSGQTECQRGQKVPITGSIRHHLLAAHYRKPRALRVCNVPLSKSLRTTGIF